MHVVTTLVGRVSEGRVRQQLNNVRPVHVPHGAVPGGEEQDADRHRLLLGPREAGHCLRTEGSFVCEYCVLIPAKNVAFCHWRAEKFELVVHESNPLRTHTPTPTPPHFIGIKECFLLSRYTDPPPTAFGKPVVLVVGQFCKLAPDGSFFSRRKKSCVLSLLF